MRVTYQVNESDPLETYRCTLSGRDSFDLTEAAHKARRLVRAGNATAAFVLEDEKIVAEWRRRGTEVIQISGPEL